MLLAMKLFLKTVFICVPLLLLLTGGIWLYADDSEEVKQMVAPAALPESAIDYGAFEDSEAAGYFFLVKAYADYMITHGRDRYGAEHSPLFATTLNRETGDVYEQDHPKAPEGIREGDRTWRGANPANNDGLYVLLRRLTAITGDPVYADEADKAIDWFFAHCQSPTTGLMAWGEHMGWDFFTEKPIAIGRSSSIHEYKDFANWDRVWETNPTAAERYAMGLWDHQIYAKEGEFAGEFSRHADYFEHKPSKGRAFPAHGGKYIKVWARAYKETGNPEFLRAITTLLDYYERQTSPVSGAINYATDFPEHYTPDHSLALASFLYKSMGNVPADLAGRMKAMADQTDPLYIGFEHDPGPGGAGFVKFAHVHTLEPGEQRKIHQAKNKIPRTSMWTSGYSASVSVNSANNCYGRYQQTGMKGYLDLFMKSGEAYYQSEPPDTREKDLYPSNFGGVISMMRNMYKETGDGKYMVRARELLDVSLEVIMDDSSPLPKASRNSDHYEAITGADEFMSNVLAMWEFLNKETAAVSTGA